MPASKPDCSERHNFLPPHTERAQRRTLVVALITLAVMVLEIVAGWLFGSMALLADGIHMGTHALAIGGAYAAYRFAQRYARDRRFSFGTGKVEALAAFANALLLAFAALAMTVEAVGRLISPHEIQIYDALAVAVFGLVVNFVCALLLSPGGEGHAHHHHGHSHDGPHDHSHDHQDLNMRGAYLHVIADALTSVLAIAALVAAGVWGWTWLDPVVALGGAVMILRWSKALVLESGRVLLDSEAPENVSAEVRKALEGDGETSIEDLHIWAIAPGRYTLLALVAAPVPLTAAEYKARLPADLSIVHPVIEVRVV